MLYPPLIRYRLRNAEGYRHVPAVVRLYGELPGDITGALVWIAGQTECRLGVVIAANATHTRCMVIGPGWCAFAAHTEVFFICPGPLRTWAQHLFSRAKLPVAPK